jgi:O-acetyl-ADP-ribose deacetylase (regulator of RNase III)
MSALTILLRDINPGVVESWEAAFAGVAGVEISRGDIFGKTADAIVSPANSFGFMDGGIDALYSRRFGWDLQERLQALLRAEHGGELPVGQAVLVETRDPEIPYCVSAPTMRVPMVVAETVNAYLAFRASLRLVLECNRRSPGAIKSLLCPGLGTAVGRMPPGRCARQMRAAYDNVILGKTWDFTTWPETAAAHYLLISTQ